MTKRVYGDPAPFRGSAKVSVCYRDELGFPVVTVSVDTPDGLHFLTLGERDWAMLYKEVKETFVEGPVEESAAEAA